MGLGGGAGPCFGTLYQNFLHFGLRGEGGRGGGGPPWGLGPPWGVGSAWGQGQPWGLSPPCRGRFWPTFWDITPKLYQSYTKVSLISVCEGMGGGRRPALGAGTTLGARTTLGAGSALGAGPTLGTGPGAGREVLANISVHYTKISFISVCEGRGGGGGGPPWGLVPPWGLDTPWGRARPWGWARPGDWARSGTGWRRWPKFRNIITMAKKVSERNITMGKEPPLFLKKNWGQFFSHSILNSDSDGASRIVLSLFVWMQFFFKMITI